MGLDSVSYSTATTKENDMNIKITDQTDVEKIKTLALRHQKGIEDARKIHHDLLTKEWTEYVTGMKELFLPYSNKTGSEVERYKRAGVGAEEVFGSQVMRRTTLLMHFKARVEAFNHAADLLQNLLNACTDTESLQVFFEAQISSLMHNQYRGYVAFGGSLAEAVNHLSEIMSTMIEEQSSHGRNTLHLMRTWITRDDGTTTNSGVRSVITGLARQQYNAHNREVVESAQLLDVLSQILEEAEIDCTGSWLLLPKDGE
jgi:hypothetical protein